MTVAVTTTHQPELSAFSRFDLLRAPGHLPLSSGETCQSSARFINTSKSIWHRQFLLRQSFSLFHNSRTFLSPYCFVFLNENCVNTQFTPALTLVCPIPAGTEGSTEHLRFPPSIFTLSLWDFDTLYPELRAIKERPFFFRREADTCRVPTQYQIHYCYTRFYSTRSATQGGVLEGGRQGEKGLWRIPVSRNSRSALTRTAPTADIIH